MKDSKNKYELTSIYKGLRNRMLSQETPQEFLELEFKQAYLKGPSHLKQDLDMESESYISPILLNYSEKYKKAKVNAECLTPFFQNAKANLQALAKETKCKVEEKYILYLSCMEQRYTYDCSKGKWTHTKKERLCTQFNVMSMSKFYRINYSSKKAFEGEEDFIEQIKLNGWRKCKGFLRFKHSTIYHLNAEYSIECNTIYESQSEKQYLIIQQAMQKKTNLTTIVKEKLNEYEEVTKNQLELKFSPQGIQFLGFGPISAGKALFSNAFKQLREITNQPDLAKMMGNLSIQTKQQRKQEKRQKGQADTESPQPRREFRKRQS